MREHSATNKHIFVLAKSISLTQFSLDSSSRLLVPTAEIVLPTFAFRSPSIAVNVDRILFLVPNYKIVNLFSKINLVRMEAQILIPNSSKTCMKWLMPKKFFRPNASRQVWLNCYSYAF